jgi:coatomer subunit beta
VCSSTTLARKNTTTVVAQSLHSKSRYIEQAIRNPKFASMASFLDNAYSLVHQDNTADQPSQQDLKTQLEKGTEDSKVETMKRILTIMLNGDPMPNLLMHIIRFVMPAKGKHLKKLLYFYYEICPKLDANGKLKQEMILVW